jgi:hypothetical protein
MSRVLRRLVPAAVLATSLLIPASASAFPLTNCTATLTSISADGSPLDTVVGGAADSTREDPFLVDWNGTVAWEGTTGGIVFTDFTWGISITGIPTALNGVVANASGQTEGSGSVVPNDAFPLELVGLFYVTGSVSGDAGSCDGSGWIQLQGDPFGTLQFWAALAAVAIGILLIVLGRGGRWLLGLVGGLLLGLGSAVLLITFSLMLLAEWTPLVALIAGVLIGLAATVRKASETPPTATAAAAAAPPSSTTTAPPPAPSTSPTPPPPSDTASTSSDAGASDVASSADGGPTPEPPGSGSEGTPPTG